MSRSGRTSSGNDSTKKYGEADFVYKVSRQYRRLGIILVLIGMILAASVIIGAIVLLLLKVSDVLTYYILLLLISVIGGKISQSGVFFIQKSKEILNPGGGTYSVHVIISCTKCGFTRTREFHAGDYVGKLTEERCDVCGAPMQVTKIYAVPERKLESTGMPILPFMQEQSIKARIQLAFMEIFAPFKFALGSRKDRSKNKWKQ